MNSISQIGVLLCMGVLCKLWFNSLKWLIFYSIYLFYINLVCNVLCLSDDTMNDVSCLKAYFVNLKKKMLICETTIEDQKMIEDAWKNHTI